MFLGLVARRIRLETASEADRLLPGLAGWQVAGLWFCLTLALVPAFFLIRAMALDVSQYQVSTFEAYAREALAAGRYGEAIEFCTGGYKTGVNRDDHHGKVFSIRAQAYAGLGKFDDALRELEACAAFWTKHYYYASEKEREEAAAFGETLAWNLVERKKGAAAQRALSAGGMVSGRPVEYLYELVVSCTEEQRKALWRAEPFLVVEDFADPQGRALEMQVEEQGRRIVETGMDPSVSWRGGTSTLLSLSESTGEGRSWYGFDVYLPLSERPYALRAYVRQVQPGKTRLMVSYWFETARKSATTFDEAAAKPMGEWQCFDVRRDFHRERIAAATEGGYMIRGGIINKIGLDIAPGPANRFWIDRVELYLPE